MAAQILPAANEGPLTVRLIQMDIAVKDDRAGATGWNFADVRVRPDRRRTSPRVKMVPVGLMWGNDPNGKPLVESWINRSAPAYAKATSASMGG